LLGIPLFLNLLEPFAFWGRIERDLILPVFSALSYLAAEGAKLLDFYMTPIPFFGRLPVVSLTALLFSALLVLTLLRGRWFCNHLCPTGALLRAPLTAGSLPLLRVRAQIDACTRCGVCEKVCKTGSIAVDRQGVKVDHETCVVCFNCLSSCPFGAMGYSTGGREKSKGRQIGEGRTAGEERRSFLKRGAGIFGSLLAGFSFLSMGRSFEGAGTPRRGAAGPGAGVARLRKKTPLGEPNTPATPPGSVSIDRFRRKCISCHRCVSVCPTHVLQPSLFEYGPGGFMQPVMDYATGYCEYECVACLSVCPVGAILPLSPEEKQKTQIGRVHFIEDRCIVFSDGTACGACAEVCPSGAVIMIPYTDELTQPQTDNDICVGCGSCEFSCPVTGGKAIYVKGNEVHVEREVRKPEKSGPVQAEPEDFPF